MDINKIPFIDQRPSIDVRKIWFYLPQDEVIGDLGLFYRTIVLRTDFINKLIANIYTEHYLWQKSFIEDAYSVQYSMPDQVQEINYNIETLVYWLRKSCDELICLQYILCHWLEGGNKLDEVRIDSIGKLLSKEIRNEIRRLLMETHTGSEDFLKEINDISNTFKHSFVNYQLYGLMGKGEPVVNALRFRMNKIDALGPDFLNQYLRSIINGYSSFFSSSLINIEGLREKLYSKFKK